MCAMRRQLSGRGEVLLAGELLAGAHVPQPELDLEPPVALARDAAGDQRLRVDRLPVGKARQRVEARDLLDEGRRIDRREQAGAPQVGGDDLRDAARAASVSPGVPPTKSGIAIGSGATLPCGDVEASLRGAAGASEQARRGGAPSASTRRRVKPNGDRSVVVMTSCVPKSRAARQPRNMSRGSKSTMTSFQASYFATGRKL